MHNTLQNKHKINKCFINILKIGCSTIETTNIYFAPNNNDTDRKNWGISIKS